MLSRHMKSVDDISHNLIWKSVKQNPKNKQEGHDGPISLTWANSFANLLLKFQPSSLF